MNPPDTAFKAQFTRMESLLHDSAPALVRHREAVMTTDDFKDFSLSTYTACALLGLY